MEKWTTCMWLFWIWKLRSSLDFILFNFFLECLFLLYFFFFIIKVSLLKSQNKSVLRRESDIFSFLIFITNSRCPNFVLSSEFILTFSRTWADLNLVKVSDSKKRPWFALAWRLKKGLKIWFMLIGNRKKII